MILAERDLLEGHPEEARARLEPLLDRAGYLETDVTRFLPVLAWAYLDLGDVQRAESTVQQALVRARQQHMRPALSDALRVQALLGIRRQHWEEVQAALEEALALCQAMPYPWAEAKTLYVFGLLHQAKGEPGLARERLEMALAILNRLGERLYAQRVELELAPGS